MSENSDISTFHSLDIIFLFVKNKIKKMRERIEKISETPIEKLSTSELKETDTLKENLKLLRSFLEAFVGKTTEELMGKKDAPQKQKIQQAKTRKYRAMVLFPNPNPKSSSVGSFSWVYEEPSFRSKKVEADSITDLQAILQLGTFYYFSPRRKCFCPFNASVLLKGDTIGTFCTFTFPKRR